MVSSQLFAVDNQRHSLSAMDTKPGLVQDTRDSRNAVDGSGPGFARTPVLRNEAQQMLIRAFLEAQFDHDIVEPQKSAN